MNQPVFVAINGMFYAISSIQHFGMDDSGALVIGFKDGMRQVVDGESAKRLLHAMQPLVLMYHPV